MISKQSSSLAIQTSGRANMQIAKIQNGNDVAVYRDGQNGYVMSLYTGTMPTQQFKAQAIGRLSVAFPKQTREFCALAIERMNENNFTEERMRDAVNYLIDNFQYRELNIADIIRFDKKKKLYTRSQMLEMLQCNGGTHKSTDDFGILKLNGQTLYYLPDEDLISNY